MKKCLFAISLVVFLASLGLAITAEYQSGQSAQKEKATKTVSGEVVSVNSTKNEVVVKDGAGAEVRLQTDKSTKVTKDGKAVSLADVKPSEKVTCEAVETTGGWLAKSIRVSSAKSGL